MYEALLIIHFLGLGLGLGAPFAMLTLRLAGRKWDPQERMPFFLKATALGRNTGIGLALLILSGLGMMFLRGVGPTFAVGGGWFHAKLTLVVVLAGLVGYMQVTAKKIRQAGGGPFMDKLPKLSQAGLVITIGIVILAVLAFR